MSFHRGNQTGAVAVSSYSSSPMVSYSPSRRYSNSAGTGTTAVSSGTIGNANTTFNTYRSAGTSSILDRPTSFYSLSSSNNFRNNVPSEYRRSYCTPSISSSYSISSGANYRWNYRSEYGRSRCSPARSISSSTYSESLSNTTNSGNTSNRYSSSSTSLAKYSPSTYTPNIHHPPESNNIHHRRKGQEISNEFFGGDEFRQSEHKERPDSSLSTSSSTSSASNSANVSSANTFWPRTKRRGGIGTVGGGERDGGEGGGGKIATTLNSNALIGLTTGPLRTSNHRIVITSDEDKSELELELEAESDTETEFKLKSKAELEVDIRTEPDAKPATSESELETETESKLKFNLDLKSENGSNFNWIEFKSHLNGTVDKKQNKSAHLGSNCLNDDERINDNKVNDKHEKSEEVKASCCDTFANDSCEGTITNILLNGISKRSPLTHADNDSTPSTSTKQESKISSASTSGNFNVSIATNNTGSLQQGHYRLDISKQFEGNSIDQGRTSRNHLQVQRSERCGLNGLRNIGNTCFMNSVIQCLSNTKPLLEYLLNDQYTADINVSTSSMKGALIKAFSEVIHGLWETSNDHIVNTTALKSQIQRFTPRFMGYNQQDAQEFLRYLLEGLHEDVNRIIVKPKPILIDIPDIYTDSQKAAESWKRYLRSEDSMIVDVFVGQLRSSLRCTTCDHVSVTLDPFWDLSLPIPVRSGTVKLSQCLEHFTREEVLDGDEKPTCSKCQMRRKCTKSFSIQKFPKILVIHLKRFSPTERFRGKLNVMVDFPLTGLDLSAFAAPRVPGCTYNLYGIANHSGTTYSGHYTAYCKHPYSGEWHEYNDSRVIGISSRSVVSNEAYVLFYEQQPHSSHL